jgi:hypothetical protein
MWLWINNNPPQYQIGLDVLSIRPLRNKCDTQWDLEFPDMADCQVNAVNWEIIYFLYLLYTFLVTLSFNILYLDIQQEIFGACWAFTFSWNHLLQECWCSSICKFLFTIRELLLLV